ncbi:MAG: glycosyltransferase [Patescibacteria group bacterium]
MPLQPTTLSIIIPAFNEERTILELVARVKAVSLPNVAKQIIIVDDGSTDGTREILKALTDCTVIFQEKNQGKGAALRRGFATATVEWVIVQDADLEYDPNEYGKLLEYAQTHHAPVVYGSRLLGKKLSEAESSSRWFLAGGLLVTWFTNLLYRTKLTDVPTCYKLFKRELLGSLDLACSRFEFCPEITAKLARQNLSIAEVPITYTPRDRAEGKKIKLRDGFEAFWTLLKYRLDRYGWWLILIIFFGFLIRILGIGYGLPYHLFGDEEAVIYGALKMLELKTLLPVFHVDVFRSLTYYPPFLNYLDLVFFIPVIGIKYFANGLPSLSVLKNELMLDTSLFFYVARTLGIMFSTANIFLLYRITEQLFPKKKTLAVIASLFLAGSFLDATLAPTARHYIPSLFFSLCATYFGLKAIKEDQYKRSAILSGIFFGITFGINYIVFFLPFIFGYLLYTHRRNWRQITDRLFYILSPFLIIALFAILAHPQPFLEQVLFHDNVEYGHTKTLLESLVYYLTVVWRADPEIFIFATIGWIALWFRERKAFWLFAFFYATVSVIMYAFLWNIPRYLAPSLPFLALISAYGLTTLMEWRPRYRLVFIIPLLAYHSVLFIRYETLILRDDTRLTAREWIETNFSNETIVTVADKLRLTATKEAITLVADINPNAIRSLDRAILSDDMATKDLTLLRAYNLYFLTNDLDREKAISAIMSLPGAKYIVTDSYTPKIGAFVPLVTQGEMVKQFANGDSEDKSETLFISGEEKPLDMLLIKKLFRMRQFGPVVTITKIR